MTLRLVWQTAQAPQWSLLILVCTLGALADGDAGFIVAVAGLIIALLLCIWALASLGYDGTNLLKFLFTYGRATWKQTLWALAFLLAAVLTTVVTATIRPLAEWLMSVMPEVVAPAPNLTLLIVQIVCVVFLLFVSLTSLIRKRAHRLVRDDPVLSMPRRDRRAMKVKKRDFDQLKQNERDASVSRDYWREASNVLTLAAIAALPGALGWNWLLGALLSIALPMFVLSVQFRARMDQNSTLARPNA